MTEPAPDDGVAHVLGRDLGVRTPAELAAHANDAAGAGHAGLAADA